MNNVEELTLLNKLMNGLLCWQTRYLFNTKGKKLYSLMS